MEFCEVCKNMLYMRLAGDTEETSNDDESGPQLSYYCRKCGNEALAGASGTSCAYRVTFTQRDSAALQPLNAHTKHDATLPIAEQTTCPTANCNEKNSVRYIRYDDKNIKYIYLCTACNATWTVSNGGGL